MGWCIGDHDGYREGWAMVEAAALSGVTDYALKFASGRQRPEQTADPNEWFTSGTSFPSLHSTAAFAVGTVLAESGNDDVPVPAAAARVWTRRVHQLRAAEAQRALAVGYRRRRRPRHLERAFVMDRPQRRAGRVAPGAGPDRGRRDAHLQGVVRVESAARPRAHGSRRASPLAQYTTPAHGARRRSSRVR